MTGSRWSRRRFLGSAGVCVTLPLLPSLLHVGRAHAQDACAPTRRFVAYHFPNGHHMPEHVPRQTGSGSAWSLPPMLESMADLKSDLLFVSGLENQQRRREFGDHAIGCGALLTARKPTANRPYTNMSVDQAIADQLTGCRGLDSLQLGTHNVGPADAFGTYYTRSISWRGASIRHDDGRMEYPLDNATPLGKEVDPQKAFDRLFQGVDAGASAAEAGMRRAMRKSVLDAVVPHGDWLRNRLDSEDRVKLDELFTGIRQLEQGLQAGSTNTAMCGEPEQPLTLEDFERQVDSMHTLMTLALQCDATRVISFMLGDALSDRNLGFISDVQRIGGEASDHSVSHHSGDSTLVAKFRAMVLWKMEQIAKFLGKLKAATDADGQSLLSNTLVFISSELADGNRHNHDDKPILLAGQLGGLVTTDRHVRFPTSRDFSQVKTYGDFFITLLDLYGVRTDRFGDDGKEAIAWHV